MCVWHDHQAQLVAWNSDLETPLAYHVGHDYGALHGKGKIKTPEDEFKVGTLTLVCSTEVMDQ